MAYPTFDGFSLQDDNYILSDITYRSIPSRSVDTSKTSRKPGVKVLSHDFGERRVRMSGHIVADSASELQTLIDELHTNVTRKNEGLLMVEADRSSTALVTSLSIADPHYAQDMVPFDIEFLLPDPFFYGSGHTVTYPVTSGSSSLSATIMISGSVFAEPSITYFSPAGSGQTTTSGIKITYSPAGEYITWSGTGATTTLAYSDGVIFDYANQLITETNIAVDVEGVFSRWEPGSTSFVVTFSGTTQGGSLQFSYQPRYL